MSTLYSKTSGRHAPVQAPGLWRLIAGFILWAVAFVVLYVGHALGCIYVPHGAQASTVSFALVVLWLPLVLACAALAWRSGCRWRAARHSRAAYNTHETAPARAPFLWRATFLIDAGALAAIIINGLPVLAFPACSL